MIIPPFLFSNALFLRLMTFVASLPFDIIILHFFIVVKISDE